MTDATPRLSDPQIHLLGRFARADENERVTGFLWSTYNALARRGLIERNRGITPEGLRVARAIGITPRPRHDASARQVVAKHDGWLDMEPGDTHGEIRVLAHRTHEELQREIVPMTARILCGPGERVQAGDVLAEVREEVAS